MKKILITLVQLGVTSALLWYVFHDANQRHQMKVALAAADYRWVGAAILAYLVVEIAAAIRWQILLRLQKIRLNLPLLFGLFLFGMFYNQFLPGHTGGAIISSFLRLLVTTQPQ